MMAGQSSMLLTVLSGPFIQAQFECVESVCVCVCRGLKEIGDKGV